MSDAIVIKANVLGRGLVREIRVPAVSLAKVRELYPYQVEILSHLENKFTLTEAPTGSGKSTIMLYKLAVLLKKRFKPIIITPQRGINDNFRKYTRMNGLELRAGKESVRILSRWFGVEPSVDKTERLLKYFRERAGIGCMPYVCTYQAFAQALGRCDDLSVLKDVVLLVDEGHHSSMDGQQGNQLGGIISKCLGCCAGIHIFTATAFRGDGAKLVNGEFVPFRRTLQRHYSEGQCPDFGVYVRFYQKVNKKRFDAFAEDTARLGSVKLLLKNYIDEYAANPLPTLMIVSNAKQAYDLHRLLVSSVDGVRVLNLGSDDGVSLVSQGPNAGRRFEELSIGKFDIVIAIKLMDEGIDWPDCAQTFSPRVSSSLRLLVQREIGRALRRKSKDHPSPNHSRIVLFEIGIRDDDKNLVSASLFELAVRLKALCEGLEFSDPCRLRLRSRVLRRAVDAEKDRLRNRSNLPLNAEIASELARSAARGCSVGDLVEECIELYGERGIRIGPIAALETLAEISEIDRDELERVFSEINAGRLNERLSFKEFMELAGDKLRRLQVLGVTDYVGILSGRNDLDQVARELWEYAAGSAAKNKLALIKLALQGRERPAPNSPLGIKLARYERMLEVELR